MLILVGTGQPQCEEHAGAGFGRLVQPRSYGRVRDTAAAGIPWAADNDCFQGLDEPAYVKMLDAIAGLPGCLFVTAPDVVGDAGLTDLSFEEWAPQIIARGLPVAYVIQEDGCEYEPRGVPFGSIDALFIGGAFDTYKLGPVAEELVREAKRLGKWVHMGRVNSRRRFEYARSIGCDSIDGTKFSMFRKTYLPDALTWHESPVDERLAASVRPAAVRELRRQRARLESSGQLELELAFGARF